MATTNKLIVFDTTLRDGEQSPGVSLNCEEKIRIGKALMDLGVDICEFGFPACAVDLSSMRNFVTEMNRYQQQLGQQHPGMTLAALARCTPSDIDIAFEIVQHARKPRIHVFYATSDIHLQYKLKKTQEEALQTIQSMVKYARSLCADIEFSAEDASRTECSFLTKVVVTAINAGATTINLPDTVGNAIPGQFYNFISEIRTSVEAIIAPEIFEKIIFSTHCHNDLGLATANSISAVSAGVRQVEVTINGIGERAGNTSLEEVVMITHLHGNSLVQNNAVPLTHTINLASLVPTSKLISEITGMAVQRNKAIVGENCCLHESGIHVDGLLKSRSTYEIFSPDVVGWELSNNGIVLGKHSGRAGYKQKMNELGVPIADDQHLNASFAKFQTLVASKSKSSNYTREEMLSTVATPSPLLEEKTKSEHDHFVPKPTSTSNNKLIVELMGDGISEEVTREGRRVLEAIAPVVGLTFQFEQHPIGGRAIDLTGNPLPPRTVEACKRSTAVLLGAVGDPKYNDPSLKVRPEQGLLAIRSELQLYQNLRPVHVYPQLIDASPFRSEVITGADIIIVRELTGGIYNNTHTETASDATDIMYYSVEEIERIVRAAADISRGRKKKLVSLDKANVLSCSRLWRKTVDRILKTEYPDIKYEHMLIDSAAMHMIKNPNYFDVIVTENLFGDILSDEAAALASSLGMMGSASLSAPGKPGLYEPVHGSAPDIAGRSIANPIGTILSVAMMLRYSLNSPLAAEAVERAIEKCIASGIVTPDIVRPHQTSCSTEQVGTFIANEAVEILRSMSVNTTAVRPLTLPEKILLHQSIGLSDPNIKPGDWIVCKVARTLASEMTWLGMSETWTNLGQPELWRKDRFFLAIDHTVDPSNYHKPFQAGLISSAEKFAKSIDLVDYFAPNESILHTEFYRQRATPGTVIIGADSHSCSAGCIGAFAAGMGAADVVMPTLTGQTFIQVPETLLIRFKHDLPFGMTGKDVMLYIMQRLKRNTVAFERAVEFSGSIRSLSVDSRFALANMTTEFGGIAGVFPSDEVTAEFLSSRQKKYGSSKNDIQIDSDDLTDESVRNFYADEGAMYADRYDIDLSDVKPLIAKYPSPDNVYAIDDPEIDAIVPEVGRSIRDLDGCFIGACTTTEEEIILGGFVLEVALKDGFRPVAHGERKMTPGSAVMLATLKQLGLIDIYQRAGFSIGAPGCSYCLAVGSDVAPPKSIWLSSQNRNFRNRMGPGSIGNLSSASTVAISSIFMKITDPRPYLARIDRIRYQAALNRDVHPMSIPIHQPTPKLISSSGENVSVALEGEQPTASLMPEFLSGRIARFEDNIDTDAIIPAQLMLDRPLERLGQHSFKHVRPNFVENVKKGRNIVVAGIGFGSGSSREEAVSCLRAVGVQAIIAKSYAFIFARNMLCLDLIGIIITDERFYELATEDAAVSIDFNASKVIINKEEFAFALSPIQRAIYSQGGVINMYKLSGPKLFARLAAMADGSSSGGCGSGGCSKGDFESTAVIQSTAKAIDW